MERGWRGPGYAEWRRSAREELAAHGARVYWCTAKVDRQLVIQLDRSDEENAALAREQMARSWNIEALTG